MGGVRSLYALQAPPEGVGGAHFGTDSRSQSILRSGMI